MSELDGPRLKIARAKAEIKRLRLAEESFRQNTHYKAVRSHFNRKTGKDIYCVRREGLPPSPEWGVYIGEIAHNLRSALDGLVYQLALLKTDTPARNTQFPIFLVGETTRFRRGRRGKKIPIRHFKGMELGDGRNMIQSLKRKHQARIERLQPYKRRKDVPLEARRRERGRFADPLYWLHEINNADKHRLIQVIGVKAGMYPIVTWWGQGNEPSVRWFRTNTLEDGTKICEAPPDVSMHPEIVPLIAFADGCIAVKGKGVCRILELITGHVSDIIESFASEF